jgi:hypothetical protein
MPELNRALFIELWQAAKSQRTPADADLALFQKYMVMHEDMHPHFDRFEQDLAAPLEVDGENLMLHIVFDAAAEKSLETDSPPGVWMLMQNMLNTGMDPGRAFHVIAQAIAHESTIAAQAGLEVDAQKFLYRAAQYAEQAQQQGG